VSTDAVDRPLSPRPTTGYVYQTSWPVMTGDIDQHLELRLDGVARYIQEAGAGNLVDAGEAEEHPHWIVNRTVIDVKEPLAFPNTVTLSRWCSALSTRWCTMRVDLVGSEGGLIETEGFWIAINSNTLTPMRVSDTLVEKFASTTDEHRLKWQRWLEHPAPQQDVQLFPLRRTDIDIFEHVTNTAYWHAVHEVMALHPEVCVPPYRTVVEYRKPIRYGEEVALATQRIGDEVHMALTVGGEVRASALLRRW
jgi:acyl-ACP thioesterase